MNARPEPPRAVEEDTAYEAFLQAKVRVAEPAGFEVEPDSVNPLLAPLTRAIVPWACLGGRRALFLRFGLHKTSTQLEIGRQVLARHGGNGIVILPLGVSHEFFLEVEARHPNVRLKFVNRQAQLEPANEAGAETVLIHVTNYETVRDGKLDMRAFTFVSLDEAAVLRGFGGSKTFREFMSQVAGDDLAGEGWEGVPFRFVATAIPDPNEYVEMLAYAAFLGVMDVGEAKTRFFKRDSEKADRLTEVRKAFAGKLKDAAARAALWAALGHFPSDRGIVFDNRGGQHG